MAMHGALEIPDHARRIFPDGVPWTRYVAVGDSTVEGLGETVDGFPPGGWPKRVADGLQAVNSELGFFNLGKRYLTARQIRDTQLAPALELRPDLVTVVAGGNDMLAKTFEPEQVAAELELMIGELLEAGATVYICSMWDVIRAPVLPDQVKDVLRDRFYAFNDTIRGVAVRHAGDPGFVFDDLQHHDAGLDPRNYSSDCQHLNSRGFAVMATAVLERLARHLREPARGLQGVRS
jgi:lysophospholipase L1-like esterase